MSIRDWVRQPEYTGENRCMPCTTGNLVIAAIVGVLVGGVSTLSGVGTFVLSIGTIYFRGCLMPGTPTLTKRYFPSRVFQWFDKDTLSRPPLTDNSIRVDPEQVLLDAGAVESYREGIDLQLTDEFRSAWHERISTTRKHDLDENYLAGALVLPIRGSEITIDQRGDAFIAYSDEAVIGQWSSQAGVIADVAAAVELGDRTSAWSQLAPAEIARVLMSLRVLLKQCPECDGPVHVEYNIVESCCRPDDVIASVCQDCDARLFEMEWDGTSIDNGKFYPEQLPNRAIYRLGDHT